MRFGEWAGRSFHQLEADPEWRRFNSDRDTVRPPGGELMSETQTRMIAEMESLRAMHQDQTIVLVSHCDPLRSVLARCLGAPLNSCLQFEIGPASVSVLQCCEGWSRVLCMNHYEEIPV